MQQCENWPFYSPALLFPYSGPSYSGPLIHSKRRGMCSTAELCHKFKKYLKTHCGSGFSREDHFKHSFTAEAAPTVFNSAL